MQLGIFAKTFPGTDPRTVLTEVAAAGFGATQYNMSCSGLPSMPDEITPEVGEAVQAAAATAGVRIAALSGTFNMIHPDAEIRRTGLRRLAVMTRAAPTLGTGLITLCTGTRDPDDQWRAHPDNGTPEAWRDLRASMAEAIRLADDAGVFLGIEPEHANVVSSAALARRLIEEMASPRLKIVFDAANLFEIEPLARQRAILSQGLDLLADRIAMAHAKDRRADGAFAPAGTGVLDYRHYLTELRRIGFDGPLVAHGLDTSEARGVARFLRETLAAVAA